MRSPSERSEDGEKRPHGERNI